MYLFLLTILILDSFLLIAVVLLQAGKGGGLAAMGAAGGGGTDSLFGSRQTATLLTKATWWVGGLFLLVAFALTLIGPGTGRTESILREGVAPVTAPAPKGPALPGPVAPATPGTESAPATPK